MGRWQMRWLAGGLALAATAALAESPAATQYRVVVDSGLARLDVEACFAALPRRLVARDRRAPRLLADAELRSDGRRVPLRARGALLPLPGDPGPGCVAYRVDLADVGNGHWRAADWRTRDALVLGPDLWLWYPDGGTAGAPWRVEFVLPPGYEVSAPWRRLGAADGVVSYLVDDRMPGWNARMAIGRFAVETIERPGGRLHYALLPGDPAPDAAALRRWVNRGVDALVAAHGRLPVPQVQLLVVPVGQGGEAVPWGEVQRGGGDAVHLYVDQRRPLAEFLDDWVLVHELAHLLHPSLDAADRWLPEGIASYYQNVLRARVGLMTPAAAWERLHAGFQRGLRGTTPGRTLAQASETMLRDRAFMRVYWSGAAIALLADVELRRRSGGAWSLDRALAALRACCLPAGRSWSAAELLGRLDRLTGDTVFTGLYRRYADSDAFPELAGLYRALGLRPRGHDRLEFTAAAPERAIRDAIMGAPPG